MENPSTSGGEPITIGETSFDDSTDFETESVKTKCIWCNRQVQLLRNQKHCQDCDSKAYKVCKR